MDDERRKQHERDIYDLAANLDRPTYNSYWDAELYSKMLAYELNRDIDRLGRQYLGGRKTLVIGASVGDVSAVGRFTNSISAINISEREVERLRKEYPHVESIVGDFETFEADECFDAVYCKSILHHLHPIEKVIGRLQGLLAPGGVLFIACEPSLLNPFAAAARAWIPSQSHTPGETPFVFTKFNRLLKGRFEVLEAKYYFLSSMFWPFVARRLPRARPLWRALLVANLITERGLRRLRVFDNLFWMMTGVYRSRLG